MITKIENALIERLRLGLGKLVYSVGSYAGEIDDANLNVRRLPACLVSYAGSDFDAKSMGMRGKRYVANNTFVVLVLARSMRSEESGRKGGLTSNEIGVNQLLDAVKYLLINQTLDGLVAPIQPKRIRTIWNNAEVRNEKLSALTIEFEVRYDEDKFLDDGCFPVGEGDEVLFKKYHGKLDQPKGELVQVNGGIFDPNSDAKVEFEVVTHES
ncbi:phage protein Gp37 [Otariodibacter oris]|uniref:Phage gp37-like protein n=1 Tax=Otariodibacter oris TaxID=1032623 RepID=A0A420XIV5_9PAST|nr:phage protein Gp37 [Otariodibacter oris]QGM80664.1 hypothetical protein A6A10_04225 [Otariodibacter oris]RKR77176.1 phage gp37-like protein [Otariodibacter oris]